MMLASCKSHKTIQNDQQIDLEKLASLHLQWNDTTYILTPNIDIRQAPDSPSVGIIYRRDQPQATDGNHPQIVIRHGSLQAQKEVKAHWNEKSNTKIDSENVQITTFFEKLSIAMKVIIVLILISAIVKFAKMMM